MRSHRVVSQMFEFAGPAAPESFDAIRGLDHERLSSTLADLGLGATVVDEVVGNWDAVRADDDWVALLASITSMVTRQRGHEDEPLAIWDDLDDLGANGRLFYFYVFALCARDTAGYLSQRGAPQAVVDQTLGVLARHNAIHENKWGTPGVDAGWWMLPTLRGELVHVGALQFHLVHIGVGTFSPFPWYDAADAARRGPGFRRGDEILGVHIPQGADLSDFTLDYTFREARRVTEVIWPTTARRLATCQTWMFDDRIARHLAPTSRIRGFADRFTMVPGGCADDADVVEFVFRRPGVQLDELPVRTALERLVVETLSSGEHWISRCGWLDLDASPALP